MIKNLGIGAALVASVCVAGCDPCHGSATDIGCEESLHIRLSEPLTGEGEYEFELSGGHSSKCTFSNPAGQTASCVGATPIIEGDAVAGLIVLGGVDGAVSVVLRRDGLELSSDTLTPKYTNPSPCSGLCPRGEITLNTEDVAATP